MGHFVHEMPNLIKWPTLLNAHRKNAHVSGFSLGLVQWKAHAVRLALDEAFSPFVEYFAHCDLGPRGANCAIHGESNCTNLYAWNLETQNGPSD